MNFDSVKGSLKELKGKIKQKWAKLTEDDLKYLEGNVDELVGRIHKAYGDKKEEIRKKIDLLKDKHLNSTDDDESEVSDFNHKSSDKSSVRGADHANREL